jgi:hypothetical protein
LRLITDRLATAIFDLFLLDLQREGSLRRSQLSRRLPSDHARLAARQVF